MKVDARIKVEVEQGNLIRWTDASCRSSRGQGDEKISRLPLYRQNLIRSKGRILSDFSRACVAFRGPFCPVILRDVLGSGLVLFVCMRKVIRAVLEGVRKDACEAVEALPISVVG